MFIQTEKDLVSLLSSFSAGKRGIGGGLTVRKQDGIKKEVFISKASIAVMGSRRKFIWGPMAKVLVS